MGEATQRRTERTGRSPNDPFNGLMSDELNKMPTYDYKCKACGKVLEIFHSMTEEPRKECPKCGKKALERQIGAGGGLIFKGSGFYITDYRSSDYQAKAKADAGSSGGSGSTKTEGSGAKSAESKPSQEKPKAKAAE